ncbi:MAG TPA: hypothetical protein VNQ77_07855 [Frankiaceae bacterium]|nr:hypothetical protein [Frankiaceae bacterium]
MPAELAVPSSTRRAATHRKFRSIGGQGAGVANDIGFTHGWALGFGTIHYTRDRGRTWGQYTFQG